MRARCSKIALGALLCVAFEGGAAADDEQVKADGPVVAFELAGDAVVVRVDAHESFVKIGCRAQSFTTLGTRAYALCNGATWSTGSDSTVVIVEAQPAPHVLERHALGGHVVSLTVIDGVVSARSASGVKPLADYERPTVTALPHERTLSLHAPQYWADQPQPVIAKPAEVHGVELGIAATGGIGVASPVAAFSLFDASFVYRSPALLYVAAYGTFGAGTAAFDAGTILTGPVGGDVQVAVGEAVVGIDTRFVAAGIGAGVAMMEDGYDLEPLVVLRGRVGDRDRFAVSWHFAFATGGPTPIGMFGGMLEFRLGSRWWLGVEAELGNEGYGRLMLDARHRLIGDGGHRTLDLRLGAGLAYITTSSNAVVTPSNGVTPNMPCLTQFSQGGTEGSCLGTNANYFGPALSLGLVWRP